MEHMKAPTLDEALEGQQKAAIEKITQTIESNNLQFYKQAANEMLENHDATSIVAAVFKIINERTGHHTG